MTAAAKQRSDYLSPFELRERIGHRIFTRRVALKMTKAEVAERAGIGKNCGSRIWKYENGQQMPRSYELRRLAQALGTSSDYLLCLTNRA